MGQGLYNLLGYGVLKPPYVEGDDEATEALFDQLYDLNVNRSYETEPDYLVVPLAVDDGCLQDWWRLPDVPESISFCHSRKARYAEDQAAFPVPDSARQTWQAAKLLFEEAGLVLPEPRLVVINDWD